MFLSKASYETSELSLSVSLASSHLAVYKLNHPHFLFKTLAHRPQGGSMIPTLMTMAFIIRSLGVRAL